MLSRMSKVYTQLSVDRCNKAIKECDNVRNFFRIGISLSVVGAVLILGVFRRSGEASNRLDAGPLAHAPQRKVLSVNLKDTITESRIAGHAAFSPRGNILAALKKQTVQLWDLEAGKVKLTLSGHKETMGVYFSPDGDTVITFGKDKSPNTKLWDSETGLLKATLGGFDLFGTAHLNALWPALITVADGHLEFWNAETGELKKTVKAYRKIYADSRFFFDSVISPNGRLVVRYGGKKAFLWQTEDGQLRAELKPPQERDYYVPYYVDIKVENASFSPNSQIVATTDSLNGVELWDTQTGQLRALLEGHSSSVYVIEFSPDGKLLATASRDATARLWDVSAGTLRATLKAGKQIARRVKFSRDGQTIAVGYINEARLWDTATGQLKATLKGHKEVKEVVVFGTNWNGIEMAFSPDSRVFLTMSDKVVNAWDARTGELISTLEGARPPVAFSPNGRLLATGGQNNTTLLWEVAVR